MDTFRQLNISLGHRGVVEYFFEFSQSSKAPLLSEYHTTTSNGIRRGRNFVGHGKRTDGKTENIIGNGTYFNWSQLYEDGLGQLMIARVESSNCDELRTRLCICRFSHRLNRRRRSLHTASPGSRRPALFALNRQNIDGVSSVIKAIEHAETERRPQLLTVATPIPAMVIDDRAVLEALSNAQAVLGRKIDLHLSYSPASCIDRTDLPSLSDLSFGGRSCSSPSRLFQKKLRLRIPTG